MFDPIIQPDSPLATLLSAGFAMLSLGLIPLLGLAKEKKKGLGFIPGCLGAIVVLLLLLFGGAYLFRGAIGERVLSLADAQLSENGVYLSYEASELDLLKGIVMEDVTLYRTKERQEPVINLSKVAIGYDPFTLIKDSGSATANVTTNDAILTLFHEGQPYPVEKLSGNLTAGAKSLVINSLKGHFAGVDMDLGGEIVFPEKVDDPEVEEDSPVDVGEEAELPTKEEKPSVLADLDLSPVADLAKELAKIESSKDAPVFKARFTQPADGDIQFDGTVRGKDFSFDGVPIDSLDLDFVKVAESDPMKIGITDGKMVYQSHSLTLKGEFDTETQVLAIAELNSNVDILDLSSRMNGGKSSNVRFASPPQVTLSGTLPVANVEGANLTGSAASSGGMIVEVEGGKELKFTNMKTDFTLKNGVLNLPNFKCETFGGQGAVAASINPFAEPIYFDGSVTLTELSLNEISKFSGAKGDRNGKVTGTFQGKGAPDLKSLNGSGKIGITEAQLVDVPIFRKLKPLLAVVSAGSLTKGAIANANYTLQDGFLKSDDMKLTTGLIAVNGKTDVNFNEESLTAEATIQAGPGGLISQLSGQSLKVAGSGPFDDFSFKFKEVPGMPSLAGVGPEGLVKALSQTETGGKIVEGINEKIGDNETVNDAINKLTESMPGLRGLGLGKKPKEEEEEEEEEEEASEEEKDKQKAEQ